MRITSEESPIEFVRLVPRSVCIESQPKSPNDWQPQDMQPPFHATSLFYNDTTFTTTPSTTSDQIHTYFLFSPLIVRNHSLLSLQTSHWHSHRLLFLAILEHRNTRESISFPFFELPRNWGPALLIVGARWSPLATDCGHPYQTDIIIDLLWKDISPQIFWAGTSPKLQHLQTSYIAPIQAPTPTFISNPNERYREILGQFGHIGPRACRGHALGWWVECPQLQPVANILAQNLPCWGMMRRALQVKHCRCMALPPTYWLVWLVLKFLGSCSDAIAAHSGE